MANKVNIERTVQTATGDVVPGAEYSVTNEGTGLAQTIYSDRAGTTVKTPPHFADGDGKVQFFVDPGALFRVEAVGGSGTASERYIEAIQLTESDADTEAGRAQKVGLLGIGAQLVTTETAFNAGVYLISGAHVVTPNLDTCSSVPPELAGVAKRGIMHVVGSSGGVLQLLSVREGAGLWYRSVTNVLVSGNDWVRFDPQGYGIGGKKLITSSGDLDTLSDAGGVLFATNPVGNLPPGTSAALVLNLVGDTGSVSRKGQIAIDYALNRLLFRGRDLSDVWGPWLEPYQESNLLGTVSQSGGVPTGAVIERGSNANGEYVKLADGSLHMTATVNADLTVTTVQTFPFPATILDTPDSPYLNFSILGIAAERTQYRLTDGFLTTSLDDSWSVQLESVNGATGTCAIRLLAVGRWF